jgi:hypothetical protein
MCLVTRKSKVVHGWGGMLWVVGFVFSLYHCILLTESFKFMKVVKMIPYFRNTEIAVKVVIQWTLHTIVDCFWLWCFYTCVSFPWVTSSKLLLILASIVILGFGPTGLMTMFYFLMTMGVPYKQHSYFWQLVDSSYNNLPYISILISVPVYFFFVLQCFHQGLN